MAITVSAQGAGDYATLQAAIDSIPSGGDASVTIRIATGVYEEKVVVPSGKPPILLLGDDPETTILTWSYNAYTLDAEWKPLGTFRTGTLSVFAERFTAENFVDYIFGGATAVFDRCRVHNKRSRGTLPRRQRRKERRTASSSSTATLPAASASAMCI